MGKYEKCFDNAMGLTWNELIRNFDVRSMNSKSSSESSNGYDASLAIVPSIRYRAASEDEIEY